MKYLICLACIIFVLSSCNSSINVNDLYGKWKYIKVDNPHAIPPDSVSKEDLAREDPSIQFFTNNTLIINWGGKVLSHGKFTIDKMNIRYEEQLPDGTTRKFPFWVAKLTDKELIFETTGEDGSRVTAERVSK